MLSFILMQIDACVKKQQRCMPAGTFVFTHYDRLRGGIELKAKQRVNKLFSEDSWSFLSLFALSSSS